MAIWPTHEQGGIALLASSTTLWQCRGSIVYNVGSTEARGGIGPL